MTCSHFYLPPDLHWTMEEMVNNEVVLLDTKIVLDEPSIRRKPTNLKYSVSSKSKNIQVSFPHDFSINYGGKNRTEYYTLNFFQIRANKMKICKHK